MRHLATLLALVFVTACNPPPASTAQSGTPRVPTTQLSVDWPPPPELAVTTTTVRVEASSVSGNENSTTAAPTTTEPAVVPATQAPAVSYTGECGGWGELVAQHFGDQAAKACQVIGCETGYTYDPTIENPSPDSTASGLLQFLDSTWVKARAMVGAEQYARAMHAPGAVQIAAGAAWLRATSWSQWECA